MEINKKGLTKCKYNKLVIGETTYVFDEIELEDTESRELQIIMEILAKAGIVKKGGN